MTGRCRCHGGEVEDHDDDVVVVVVLVEIILW